MEAEYTALSMALCVAIPLLYITKSIHDGLNFCAPKKVTFKATVKFYALKMHWFWSWLKPDTEGIAEIDIVHCDTSNQKADFLTKALVPAKFVACCQLSLGWWILAN